MGVVVVAMMMMMIGFLSLGNIVVVVVVVGRCRRSFGCRKGSRTQGTFIISQSVDSGCGINQRWMMMMMMRVIRRRMSMIIRITKLVFFPER